MSSPYKEQIKRFREYIKEKGCETKEPTTNPVPVFAWSELMGPIFVAFHCGSLDDENLLVKAFSNEIDCLRYCIEKSFDPRYVDKDEFKIPGPEAKLEELQEFHASLLDHGMPNAHHYNPVKFHKKEDE